MLSQKNNEQEQKLTFKSEADLTMKNVHERVRRELTKHYEPLIS